ncbi:phage major capsid protein [Lacticaseibacillus kribbianus]|uniref:phage major capsid protein n=1 Tax=Lacticaseibacillus kribbianus TaxID=2926292 RepID=UPI001CD4B7AB|nr:phage major capsid protein [Lacticaseibacillus kribbianus]
MENPIILNARLKMARAALAENETKRGELESKKQVILRAADEAADQEALDKAAADSDENDKSMADLEKENQDLKDKIADLEKQLEDANETPAEPKEPQTNAKKGGETRMKTIEKENPEVRSLIDYLNSKGQKRDGIVSGDVAAIIPQQILYKAQDELKSTYDLTKFADVISVQQAGGTYVVAKKTDESLHTVEELAANPELGKPELITVKWNAGTYRGSITTSHESLRDATDLNRLLQNVLDQVVLNTKNRLIAEKLKTAPAASATDADGIKKIINVDLDPAYNKVVIATQSGFQFLDTLKDGEGRYLMQPDVTSATGYRFLGLQIGIVPDTALGEAAGDALAFIGDAKRFVKLFDREEVQLGWAVNENFAQAMLAAISVDAEVADTAAGYLVTLGPKA